MNPIKLVFQRLSFALSIIWGVANFTAYPTSVVAESSRLTTQTDSLQSKSLNQKELDPENLDFSGTGRPNNRTPGGSRPFGCPRVDRQLTALVPTEMGLTVSESPTFWLYIPYEFQNVQAGEFVLQDERGERDIYRTPVTLSGTPGIISIRLPSNLSEPLVIGQPYLWSFIVFCHSEDTEDTDANVFVEGYVQRVTVSSALQDYRDYANNKIWYGALNELAESRRRDLQNWQLKKDWEILLETVGLESLAQEPLLQCCTPER